MATLMVAFLFLLLSSCIATSTTSTSDEVLEIEYEGQIYHLLNVTLDDQNHRLDHCPASSTPVNADRYITADMRYDLCKAAAVKSGRNFESVFDKSCFGSNTYLSVLNPCYIVCLEKKRVHLDDKVNDCEGEINPNIYLFTGIQCGDADQCNKDGCCIAKATPPTTTTTTETPTITTQTPTETPTITTQTPTETPTITTQTPTETPTITTQTPTETPTITTQTPTETPTITTQTPTETPTITTQTPTETPTITTQTPTNSTTITTQTPTHSTTTTTQTPTPTIPPPTPTPTIPPPTPNPKPQKPKPEHPHVCQRLGYSIFTPNRRYYFICKIYATVHSCGVDQKFDPNAATCQYDQSIVEPELPFEAWRDSITCPGFGVYLRVPYNCKYYFTCEKTNENGGEGQQIYFNRCPDGLIFDQAKQKCDYKSRRCNNRMQVP